MSRRIMALLLAFACLFAGATTSLGATPQHDAATQALDYIRTLQNADGGFPSYLNDSSAGGTLDAMLAFTAAGVDPSDVTKSGHSPLDYLTTQAAAYSATPGGAAKLVIVLKAAGEDPHDFAGADYVAKMESFYDGAAHTYGVQVIDQALYLLARKSLGLAPASGSVGVLESKQLAGGCWEYADLGCDTNSTAMAVQALVAAGIAKSDSLIQAAMAYYKSSQNSDGGFPYVAPGDSDANSTAFVLQALVAAGEDIDGGGPWEKPGGRTPMQALLAFRDVATGAFTYAGKDNAYATYQAVPALLLQPLLLPRQATATPHSTRTPVATRTRTPAATSTFLPTETAMPPLEATPVSVVLSATVAPPNVAAPDAPRALVSAGQGADAESPAAVTALLLVAAVCLGGGTLIRFAKRR